MVSGVYMGLGGLWTVLFWGLLILGTAWLAHAILTDHQPTPQVAIYKLSTIEILKQRYARGEISAEQFQAMRRDLNV